MKQSVFLHGKQTTGSKSVKLNSACLSEWRFSCRAVCLFPKMFNAALAVLVSIKLCQVLPVPAEGAWTASCQAAVRQVQMGFDHLNCLLLWNWCGWCKAWYLPASWRRKRFLWARYSAGIHDSFLNVPFDKVHLHYSKILLKEIHHTHRIPKPMDWKIQVPGPWGSPEKAGRKFPRQPSLQETEHLDDGFAFGVIHEEGQHKSTVSEKHGENDFAGFRSYKL